ncbi:MAG: hypothetical protein AABW99_05365 [archaeon]|mgnify:CR=1 FL=1
MKKTIIVKIGADMLKDLDGLKTPKGVDAAPDHVVYFDSCRQFSGILSQKRLELLTYLSQVTGKSVTKIALELHRKKEAVSRDLHQLNSLGFVEMKKQGKNVYPKVNYDKIQIELCSTQ